MKTIQIFFNIEDRTTDSTGQDLSDFRYEVGDEMIADHDGTKVTVTVYPQYGQFVFEDPKESEISPYVSLEELFSVALVNGRFRVG